MATKPDGAAFDWVLARLVDDDSAIRNGAADVFAHYWQHQPQTLAPLCSDTTLLPARSAYRQRSSASDHRASSPPTRRPPTRPRRGS
jgi:hypothetical protein